MARPSKLTPEVRKKLLLAVAAGATLRDAAAYAGISKSSFDRYREQDKTLADDLEAAEGRAAVAFVSIISQAAKAGDWRAAAWWLERRRPEEWGKREQLALTGQGGGPIQVEEERQWDIKLMTDDELRTLQDIYTAVETRSREQGTPSPNGAGSRPSGAGYRR